MNYVVLGALVGFDPGSNGGRGNLLRHRIKRLQRHVGIQSCHPNADQSIGVQPPFQFDGKKVLSQRGSPAARGHLRRGVQRDGIQFPANKAHPVRLALFCSQLTKSRYPLCHSFSRNRPLCVKRPTRGSRSR